MANLKLLLNQIISRKLNHNCKERENDVKHQYPMSQGRTLFAGNKARRETQQTTLSSCLRYNTERLLPWVSAEPGGAEAPQLDVVSSTSTQLNCVHESGTKLLLLFILCPFSGKIPYKTNTPLYLRELFKELTAVGREAHVCWLVVALKVVC